MEIHCEAKNAHDIIQIVADKLNTTINEDGNELCFDLPEEVGSGHIKSVLFDFGFSVFEIDVLLKKKLVINFEKDSINALYVLFNLDSSVSHKFSTSGKANSIKQLESLMSSAGNNESHSLILKKGNPINVFTLIINRKLFESKVEAFVKDMDDNIEMLFRDVNGINQFDYKNFFTLEISKLIEEFKNCDLTDFMKATFLEGKAYEILTRQLENYLSNKNGPDGRTLLRNATINKVKNAVDIIESQLETRISVNSLAKKVGLNQNTLQNGFKTLFRKSVNEYIQHQRLEQAKDLIENSALNITEITYKIGINSRSYFSKVFKEKFGVTPNQYLSQVRNKAS